MLGGIWPRAGDRQPSAKTLYQATYGQEVHEQPGQSKGQNHRLPSGNTSQTSNSLPTEVALSVQVPANLQRFIGLMLLIQATQLLLLNSAGTMRVCARGPSPCLYTYWASVAKRSDKQLSHTWLAPNCWFCGHSPSVVIVGMCLRDLPVIGPNLRILVYTLG